MKKIIYQISALALLGFLATSPVVSANQNGNSVNFVTNPNLIGNDANSRTIVDTASNFTVIDTNHPASSNGQITSFNFYASNTNPFRFVIVDGSGKIQWVSPQITPLATGTRTYTLQTPVSVQTGWNVGMYFPTTGVIPFESTGANASWTSSGSGMPSTGMTLSYAGSGSRTYSFVAYGTNGQTNPPSSSIAFPGFGFGMIGYDAGGLQRYASFFATSTKNTRPFSGTGVFQYKDANGDWYNVSVRYAAIKGDDVFFAGRVTSASNSSWVNQWLYAKAHDGGSSGDTISGQFETGTAAISHFSQNNLTNPSGPFNVTSGDLMVIGNLGFINQ